MFVSELSIKKAESWESNAGQLKASVTLIGDFGKQEIQLSSAAVSRIFTVIVEEVTERAKRNASLVKSGLEEAIARPMLEAAATIAVDSDEIPF